MCTIVLVSNITLCLVPAVLVAILAVVLIIIMRRRYNRLLKSQSGFFTGISQLFRTPLTYIISPLRSMNDSDDYTDEQKSLFNFMLGNALRLLRLTDSVADLGSDHTAHNSFVAEKTDLISFITDICKGFEPVAEQQGVAFKYVSQSTEFSSYVDREKIDTAFYILLSEIFAYNSENKSVSLSIEPSGNNILIKVCDNDSELPVAQVASAFENSFSEANIDRNSLPNMSLWLVKHYVELHHGSISVAKSGNKGVEFSITLTPGTEFKSDNITTGFEHIKPVTLPKAKNTLRVSGDGKEGGSDTVLIVDSDNNILNYMSALLSPLYNVETASNGMTGFDKAVATLPDLIITAISMPKKDGLEMCRQLKDNFDTCHIPIVVLSVEDSVQRRMECAQSGGDLFIAKPFDFQYLSLMVKKLLEQRKMLKNKFGSDVVLPEGRLASIPERDLLKRVIAVIKKRMSDPNLNVETLSAEIGMSRGHLQRKFKAITGQNPNEYIRETRLNTAAELLLNKDISIKEIADITGFGSQSYFCTLFLKQFNISPKQYRSQGRSSEE